MNVSPLHLRHQLPVIAALLRTATGGGKPPKQPTIQATLPPRPDKLLDGYIRHTGGDPAWYKNTVPPHLFPQWGFPLLAQTLAGQPHDLTKILNGGAEFTVHAPLPAGQPLEVSARLAEVDENDSRILFRQELVTGTASAPKALEAAVFAVLPKKGGNKEQKDSGEKPRVPADARETGEIRLPENAGLDFAFLTGDFNPIHWLGFYARMAGFSNVINHGFSTMARTVETLNRNLFMGDTRAITRFSCRFTRPLVLPARVRVYTDGRGGVYTATARGTRPFLMGEYETAN